MYVQLNSFTFQLTTSTSRFQTQLRDALRLHPQDSWSTNIRTGIIAVLQNRVGMLRQFA